MSLEPSAQGSWLSTIDGGLAEHPGTHMRNFHDLQVWQKAHQLAQDLGNCNPDEYALLAAQVEEVERLLTTYRSHLLPMQRLPQGE